MNPSVLCFRKIPVAKKFMDKGGGEVSRFSVRKFFVSQCRNFPQMGGSLTVAVISGNEKFSIRGGGREYQDFPSRNVCLTVP